MPPKPKKNRATKPKRTSRRPNPSPDRTAPDVPHWLPTGCYWNELPENIRQAVPRILAPAYRRFVLDAPGELERSVGVTLVHLMWLELCDQIQMALATGNPTSLDAVIGDRELMIDRHLRLATVKCQTAELLLKVQVVNNALQRPALPAIVPVGAAVAPPHPNSFQPAPIFLDAPNRTEPEIGNSPSR
jgi:hypothetical protein